MSEQRTTDPLAIICGLCGYRLGKHVAPAYGTPSETPTGLWCPSDARLGDKALPQLEREQANG